MTPALIALALAASAVTQETPPSPAPSSPPEAAAAPAPSSSPAAGGESPATPSGAPSDAAPAGVAVQAHGPDSSLNGATQAGAAPTDPFGLVSWCAGAVQGYLALKPEIFPEVKRIETQFRRPGSNLAEDLQDYADMEKDARRQMGLFQDAIGAAEKASPNDLSAGGLAAYKRGLAVWAAPTGSTKARIAQEWMSWALPATCESTAKSLTTQASLMGEALKPTASADSAPAPAPVPEAAQPAPAPTAAETSTTQGASGETAAPAPADQAAQAPTTRPVDTPKVRSVKKKKAAPAGT